MAQEWDIKPRSAACMACENEFDDGDICHSALVPGEEGYRRADFCDNCWQHGAGGMSPFSTWRGRFVRPSPPPEEPLKKENAESLLRRLMEDEQTSRNVIYILAVMLERKKVLVEKDVKPGDDGSSLRVYEHRTTGESFLITDPHLLLDQLEAVQQEVIEMLGGPAETAAVEEQDVPGRTESESRDQPQSHV